MEMICIRCPNSCKLQVTKRNGKIHVSGNLCPRGVEYGEQEATHPLRTITTIKQIKNGTISLKTSVPVEKKVYFDVLEAIKNAPNKKAYRIGDVLIKNVCNTKSNIVVTGVNVIPKTK